MHYKRYSMKNVVVIGIAGGTGYGKSTMIDKIRSEFHEKITILSHDFYYKEHSNMELEERGKLNYDHTNPFQSDLFIEHKKALKNWESINRPVYYFTRHKRVKETVH